MAERAVFDCMIFVQAVTSNRGPSFRCFSFVEEQKVTLLVSPSILAELEDVLNRPRLRERFPILTPERVAAYMAKFRSAAVLAPDPERMFNLPRDPDDEPYTDLAIAAKARYLVTWNERHLAYLMRRDTPEGIDFCKRFPGLSILTPPDFLTQVESAVSGNELSTAVILFLGHGEAVSPRRNRGRLVQEFGDAQAAALESQVLSILEEVAKFPVDWSKHSLLSAELMVLDEIHRRHPHLSQAALRALGWDFAFNWR